MRSVLGRKGPVARSPVPIEYNVSPEDHTSEITAAAYFVCAGGVSNLAQHARASADSMPFVKRSPDPPKSSGVAPSASNNADAVSDRGDRITVPFADGLGGFPPIRVAAMVQVLMAVVRSQSLTIQRSRGAGRKTQGEGARGVAHPWAPWGYRSPVPWKGGARVVRPTDLRNHRNDQARQARGMEAVHQEAAGRFEAREPQLIAMNVYLNEDGSEMTSVQVHPDAASMDLHMQILDQVLGEDMAEWVDRADFLEIKHIEIYGQPSGALLQADQRWVDSGVFTRAVKPVHVAGFTRSTAV
jgi:hypothetical protein